MKKLLYLLLFIMLIGCQKMPISKSVNRNIPITFLQTNVGTVPNDGTGDPIRTFAQKQNANWTTAEGLFGDIYTEDQTEDLVNDSLNALRAAAQELSDLAFLKEDANTSNNAVTLEYLESFGGGGGGVGMYELRGIVGTTSGFPTNGDSLIINTGFITHPHIIVYREGQLQWQNTTNAASPDGYKFNNVTGTLTFKPVLTTGELVVVHAFDPIIWTSLVPEGGAGGGGGSGENSLLTDLIASYSFDETTGSTFADNVADNDGVSNATASSTAKFGYSRNYVASSEYSTVPYDASLAMSGDVFAVSLWVRFTTLPSITGRNTYLFYTSRADANYWSNLLYVNTSDELVFYAKNTVPTAFEARSVASAFIVDTWYNIIAVVDGAGNNLKLLINGVDAANTTEAFTGSLYSYDSPIYIGGDGNTGSVAGYVDEVNVWLKSLSAPEITDLQTKDYPFN